MSGRTCPDCYDGVCPYCQPTVPLNGGSDADAASDSHGKDAQTPGFRPVGSHENGPYRG